MSGQMNMHEFQEIYKTLQKYGVMTLDDLASRTRFTKDVLKHRMVRYVRDGLLYRVRKNQYSHIADATPIMPKCPNKAWDKRKADKQMTKVLYTCFHNMVSARDV